MNERNELLKELNEDVEVFLKEIFNDHYEEIPQEVIDSIVENVVETSGFEDEGIYNDTDITLAYRRIMIDLMRKTYGL